MADMLYGCYYKMLVQLALVFPALAEAAGRESFMVLIFKSAFANIFLMGALTMADQRLRKKLWDNYCSE